MFVVGEIRRRSIENSLSFALASTLVPEGVSALGEIGRDLLRALRLLFQNESLSGSPPVITAEHRELLFGSIRQYFDDYQDGEYVLLGFGVDSVEVVNRGFANMPVHLPGPQTAGGRASARFLMDFQTTADARCSRCRMTRASSSA